MATNWDLLVKIGGDTSQLQDAAKKGKKELDDFKKSSKEAGQVIEGLKGPTEKYAAEQRKLNKLLDQGKITQDQHAKAMDNAKAKMDKTKESGSALNRVFGDKSGQSFKAALAGIGTAAAVVSEHFKRLKADATSALDSMKGNKEGNKRLAQIATSSSDLEMMQLQADAISKRTGMSREDSRGLVFSARSEGFDGEGFGDVARASALVGSDGAAQVAGGFRTLFRGRQDLTSKQAISGVLKAAQNSKLDFDELAQAASPAAESAGAAGTSAEELLGSLSVLSSRFKSGLTAGDRLKAFQAKVGNSDLAGQGILGSFESLQGMSEEDRGEFLGGSTEVKAVYDALVQDAELIRTATRSIAADFAATTQGGGSLATQVAIQDSDGTFISGRNARAAEINKNVAFERDAISQQAIDTAKADARARNRNAVASTSLFSVEGAVARAQSLGTTAMDTSLLGLPTLNQMTLTDAAVGVTGARINDMQADAAKQAADTQIMLQTRIAESLEKIAEKDEESTNVETWW